MLTVSDQPSAERIERVEEILRTILDVRATDSSRELIDLELQILRIRARLANN